MGSLRRGDGMTLILTISRRRDNLDCRNHSDHLPPCVSAEDEDAASPSLWKQRGRRRRVTLQLLFPRALEGDHPSFLRAAGRLCQGQLAPPWALKAPRGPIRRSETRTVPPPCVPAGAGFTGPPRLLLHGSQINDRWIFQSAPEKLSSQSGGTRPLLESQGH